MPTYVVFADYTNKGIANIKDAPDRLDAVRKLVADHGGEVKAFYLMLGDHDIMTIIDAPNDDTAAKLLLTIGGEGNVRTKSYKAFEEDEFRSIVKSLP
ncbi:MAG: GYD family protein [Rhodospirillaceae bacterium]|nr:GYD family protein [Rhodospirillaceae bacterium]